MATGKRPIALFLTMAIGCLGADLLSKYTIFAHIAERGNIVLHPDYLQFVARLNQGGMWSIGHDFGARSNATLCVFSGMVAGAIGLWALFGLRAGERSLAVVLGMIQGGALGNLYDRLFFHGVRDFIEVHYKDVYYYPTFNLADSCLVCGALYMAFVSFFRPTAAAPQAPTVEGQQQTASG